VGDSRLDAAPQWRELFTGGLARTTVGLLLMETVVAVQALVTIAVLPAVTSDRGGLRLYGVALSASGLATVAALPVTPRLVRRYGLRLLFFVSIGVFLAGSVVVLVAPDMPVFVIGRLIQGVGAGAQYALLLAIFTRRYPVRLRPRMFAAWAAAWAVPGLAGPAYGGFVASTLGWRWAFALILPLIPPAVLLLRPDIRDSPPDSAGPIQTSQPASIKATVGLGLGLLLVLVSLAIDGASSLAVGVIGLSVTVMSLLFILPRGSFSARMGLPAVIASAFLANAAFFAVEGFLPALLTGTTSTSLTVADLIVTCGVLAWVAGTWVQSRVATTRTARSIVTVGGTLMLLGVSGVILGSQVGLLPVVFVAWASTGVGMGMAYPAIALLATELAVPGSEVVTLAQYQLAEILGSAIGPGLVGGILSVSVAANAGLRSGILVGFCATCAVLLLLLSATRRLPSPGS
jgi:MFS family permease